MIIWGMKKMKIYNPKARYTVPKTKDPIETFKYVLEIYEMFADEFKKRGIKIIVTEHRWKELKDILKEHDKKQKNK